MKITRAYIEEEKPEKCEACPLYYPPDDYFGFICMIGAEDYSHCPLIYAPSKSVMRRLDIQLDDNKGEE